VLLLLSTDRTFTENNVCRLECEMVVLGKEIKKWINVYWLHLFITNTIEGAKCGEGYTVVK
jgi:hypothetical protein